MGIQQKTKVATVDGVHRPHVIVIAPAQVSDAQNQHLHNEMEITLPDIQFEIVRLHLEDNPTLEQIMRFNPDRVFLFCSMNQADFAGDLIEQLEHETKSQPHLVFFDA